MIKREPVLEYYKQMLLSFNYKFDMIFIIMGEI